MRSNYILFLCIMAIFTLVIVGVCTNDIQIDEANNADNAIKITAWLNDNQPIVKNISLNLTKGKTINNLTFLPSNLMTSNEEYIISRKNIEIHPDSDNFIKGTPTYADITIRGVAVPGIYNGTIKILWKANGSESSETKKVSLNVKTHPTVSVLPEYNNIRLNLAKDSFVPKWINEIPIFNFFTTPFADMINNTAKAPANFLLPSGAYIDDLKIPLENSVGSHTKIIGAIANVKGDKNGYPFPFINMDGGRTLSSNNSEYNLILNFNRNKIPPDHYTGILFITLEDGISPLTIPLDMNVRSGPTYVFFFLVIGIIVGRLYKYYQEKGNSRAKNLKDAHHLKTSILRMSNTVDRNKLDNELETNVFEKIYEGEDNKIVSDEIGKIEKKRKTLSSLSLIEDHLNDLAISKRITEEDKRNGGDIIARIRKSCDFPPPEPESNKGNPESDKNKNEIAMLRGLEEKMCGKTEDLVCHLKTNASQPQHIQPNLQGHVNFALEHIESFEKLETELKKFVDILKLPIDVLDWYGNGIKSAELKKLRDDVQNDYERVMQIDMSVRKELVVTPNWRGAAKKRLWRLREDTFGTIGNFIGWAEGIISVYIQVLMYLALLLGLSLVGLNTIYINNSTFGANPFPDYFSAFAWGLGAEIASRTFSNLNTPGGNS